MRLFEEYRYFFYITNDRELTAEQVVFSANDRCDQENLIAQLKNGVHCADDTGGRPDQQLGVHGDRQPGVEPEGMDRLDDAGIASARGQAQGREAIAAADGVLDVLRGDHPDALPDRQERRPIDLPVAVVEPVARGLPAIGRAAARLLVVLTRAEPEVGVWMPRSAWAIERREGEGNEAENSATRAGDRTSGQ